jgi:predicted TIM-barrel fold metal-dependent hydrolase
MPQPNRIDVHFHAIPEFYRNALTEAGRGATISTGTPAWSEAAAREVMDANDIATAILSISQPGVHFGDDAAARRLARRCNSYFAEKIAREPARFGSFAVTPLPEIAGALEEIAFALDELRLDGVGLLASYGEKFLGDPVFDPVLELLNERHATVFVHPNFHPASRRIDLGLPGFVVEFPFDTTRAAVNLIFSGAPTRFSNVRFILAHAGGTLPYLAPRLEAALAIDRRYVGIAPEQIRSAIRSFWYDTALSAGPAALLALQAVADPARIVFGSDWPYAPPKLVSDSIAGLTAHLSPPIRQAVESKNATALFPRLAAISRPQG